MGQNYEDLDFPPRPFWFISTELLSSLWQTELKAVIQLFAKYPNLRKLFDAPETTIPQRTACYELLAHRRVMEIIDETVLDRHEDLPALSHEESNALGLSQNLVTSDAPAWVQEINQIAEWLPVHIHRALPEPLHQQGFCRNDPAKDEAVRSAARTLSTIEQIQALTAQVFNEQLQRLKNRWSVTLAQAGGPKRPKHWSKGYEGLGPKVIDLSKYKHLLTDKQEMAFSLKNEYELGPTEIASRMGIDRKTLSEHLEAADKRINHAYSRQRRSTNRAKNSPE